MKTAVVCSGVTVNQASSETPQAATVQVGSLFPNLCVNGVCENGYDIIMCNCNPGFQRDATGGNCTGRFQTFVLTVFVTTAICSGVTVNQASSETPQATAAQVGNVFPNMC